ncbi:MAG TPA: ribosome silencing factor [Chthonomonadaceae bacterium]|nr:ribosome silencing factor [Chthonomonadaceae bacterium]
MSNLANKTGRASTRTAAPTETEAESPETDEARGVDEDVLALLEDDGEFGDEPEDDDDVAAGDFGLSSEEKVAIIVRAADAVKAEEIVALDVRALTIITDFFVICTGKSSIQIRAISDRIDDKIRQAGERKLRIEGRQEATWILMDYGDVVVHIMAAEQREFYKLEELWSAAPRVELDLLPA